MSKIEIDGWVEADEKPKNNIPRNCPKCSGKLKYTNALQTCGQFFVFCMNIVNGKMCRWCEIYADT